MSWVKILFNLQRNFTFLYRLSYFSGYCSPWSSISYKSCYEWFSYWFRRGYSVSDYDSIYYDIWVLKQVNDIIRTHGTRKARISGRSVLRVGTFLQICTSNCNSVQILNKCVQTCIHLCKLVGKTPHEVYVSRIHLNNYVTYFVNYTGRSVLWSILYLLWFT